MVMHFYWGLGVGHVYAHDPPDLPGSLDMADQNDGEEEEKEFPINDGGSDGGMVREDKNEEDEKDEDEDEDDKYLGDLGMGDRENDGWMDEDSDDNEGDNYNEDE